MTGPPTGRARRLVARLLALSVVCVSVGTLAACGSSDTDLAVTVAATQKGSVKPGEAPAFVLTIVNRGPSSASGVTARVDMPSGFQYQATTSVVATRLASRASADDPKVRSQGPTWGQWSLAAPQINADGTRAVAEVDITFTAVAGGTPGDYTLTPHLFADGQGEDVGPNLAIHVDPAALLTVTVSSEQRTVARGDNVIYNVTITNAGTGAATGVGLLLTLPPSIIFSKTVRIQGNSARDNPVDPVGGSLIVYYSGWTIPPKSSAGPGLLVITMQMLCSATASGGTFPVSGQVTDSQGDVIPVADSAPITIAAPTASPSPGAPGATPGATPPSGSTPAPRPTPAPTPTPTPKRRRP